MATADALSYRPIIIDEGSKVIQLDFSPTFSSPPSPSVANLVFINSIAFKYALITGSL